MDNEENEEQHLGRGAHAIVGGEPSIVLLHCRDHWRVRKAVIMERIKSKAIMLAKLDGFVDT
jgi:hypothetical protein